jgi:hypothetical protein
VRHRSNGFCALSFKHPADDLLKLTGLDGLANIGVDVLVRPISWAVLDEIGHGNDARVGMVFIKFPSLRCEELGAHGLDLHIHEDQRVNVPLI